MSQNLSSNGSPKQQITQPVIPRWRGFNLPELSGGDWGKENPSFYENDFKWISELGFNFVRIPISYWNLAPPDDWMNAPEEAYRPLDQAVEFGQKFRIHVNINFHRIPGYCVNGAEQEPFQLFGGPRAHMIKALEAAIYHWQIIATRYKGIPSKELSFDLFNEPPWLNDHNRYIEIVHGLSQAIRQIDPNRLIFADGADIGQTPVPELTKYRVVHSTRGYLPKAVSHYTADWVTDNEFETFKDPDWPIKDDNGRLWNKETLRHELIDKWKPIMDQGAPIHVGEWGCFNRTPHGVTLAWMKDMLELWNEVDWGWALWNFRGSFGILNSGRDDVEYKNFRGHHLDEKMLDLLQKY